MINYDEVNELIEIFNSLLQKKKKTHNIFNLQKHLNLPFLLTTV